MNDTSETNENNENNDGAEPGVTSMVTPEPEVVVDPITDAHSLELQHNPAVQPEAPAPKKRGRPAKVTIEDAPAPEPEPDTGKPLSAKTLLEQEAGRRALANKRAKR